MRSKCEYSPEGLWEDWPKWESEHTFRTPNLIFQSSWSKREAETFPNDHIPIHKPRGFLDLYRDLLRGVDARSIAEIGYLHGGMVAFLADMVPGAKVVGIDINQPPAAITDIIDRHHLSHRARFHGGVSQDDRCRVRSILDAEFGDESLDLIVDDASHLYEESKASFEACFGYLRPGGHYIIEDWGWAHWDHKKYQAHPNRFSGRTPLTQLIFELTMVLATRPGIVARLDVPHGALAVVTRGGELRYKESLDLGSAYLTSGRRFVGLRTPRLWSDLFTYNRKPKRKKSRGKKSSRQSGNLVLPGH